MAIGQVGNLLPLEASIALVNVDPKRTTDGTPSVNFRERWNAMQNRLNRLAYLAGPPIVLIDQHASIVAAPLVTGQLPAGRYAIRYYVRVTTPDGVSSSIAVSFAFTDGSGQTVPFPAVTGDTVTSLQSGIVPLIESTGVITYSTTYASNTPDKMRYRLSLTLERVG